LLGSKVYTDPAVSGVSGSHYHIEIPGSACDALLPDVFQLLISELSLSSIRFNVKRLDLAFDDAPFTPKQFYDAVYAGSLISLAKRETLQIIQSPFEVRDNGEVGTSTVYIGSGSSQRMVRVYDKRGGTRLEFQLRDERANAIALSLFALPYSDWWLEALRHLRQYIDFVGQDWWAAFVCFADRANLIISSARVVTLQRMERWLNRQVFLALSVYLRVWGEGALDHLADVTTKAFNTRDLSRYQAILQLAC
jgi:DNA relaxase NicK